MMSSVNNLAKLSSNVPLELRHYGTQAGSFSLYDDDGESFDYERGEFSVTELQVRERGNQLVGQIGRSVGNWDSRFRTFNWEYMTR